METNIVLIVALSAAISSFSLAPAYSRAAPHSGVLECQGILEHGEYSNSGFYTISDREPCRIDGHSKAGKKILAVCREGDMCKLKAFGTWAVDFYVERVISIERLPKPPAVKP
jgi:hypothetical protein